MRKCKYCDSVLLNDATEISHLKRHCDSLLSLHSYGCWECEHGLLCHTIVAHAINSKVGLEI
jgi:hypothetical protein